MSTMKIEERILIKEKVSHIYPLLSDLHHWTTWSPWLLAEPDCKVHVSPSGDAYQWDGKIVGAGQMMLTEKSESYDYLAMDLQFLKPWKSFAKVAFHLEESTLGTVVRWTMESHLPFFLFWMKKSMTAYIHSDYQRGLRLLKDWIKTGKTQSELSFQGIKSLEAVSYVGLKRKTAIHEIGESMEKDFEQLMQYVHQDWKNLQVGAPFSIYHR
ncbi:MAG: SRPBCC family protein [Flavobacteriaceae bacterium]